MCAWTLIEFFLFGGEFIMFQVAMSSEGLPASIAARRVATTGVMIFIIDL